jgi:predicted dehydrogenase
MSVKIVFIGCGGIANAHMERLAKISDVKFVGMCDIEKEKSEKAARIYGGQVFTDYKKMLKEIEVDACYICIPPFTHKDQEITCIEKNIPFFIEKPVHLDLKKAKKIAEKIKEKKIITSVGYVLRYFDIVDKAKEILKNEEIGLVRGTYWGEVPGGGYGWTHKKEMSGGQLIEQATHTVDMMRYFLGEIEQVFAYKFEGINNKIYQGYNSEDASTTLIKFTNGIIGNISCTWLLRGFSSSVEVIGKDIILTYQGNTITIEKGNKKETYISNLDPMLEEDKAFISSIIKKDPSMIKSDYIDALKTFEVTIRANESMKKGKVINI